MAKDHTEAVVGDWFLTSGRAFEITKITPAWFYHSQPGWSRDTFTARDHVRFVGSRETVERLALELKEAAYRSTTTQQAERERAHAERLAIFEAAERGFT